MASKREQRRNRQNHLRRLAETAAARGPQIVKREPEFAGPTPQTVARMRPDPIQAMASLEREHRDAADEIVEAFTAIAGSGVPKTSSFELRSPSTAASADDRLFAGHALIARYREWRRRCDVMNLPMDSVIDVVVFRRSLREVSADRMVHRDALTSAVVRALDAFCFLRGWTPGERIHKATTNVLAFVGRAG